MHEIRIPEISDKVTEGKVISIAVAVGDVVATDQTLLELETDKAVVAIPSDRAGRITEILVAEGDTVKVGAVIMRAEVDGEPAPATPAASSTTTTTTPSPPPETSPDLHTVRTGDQVAPAAPSIRRLARDLGVDIHQVEGTGPGGRIGEEDVRSFVRANLRRPSPGGSEAVAAAAPVEPRPRSSAPDARQRGASRTEPLGRVREITADRMSQAWSTIPMVTQHDEADITRLEGFRRGFNSRASTDARLTLTAVLLKISAAALRVFPHFNASLDLPGKALILEDDIHIGVAVDTASGLLVPVIRDVEHKGIEQLALELNTLAASTRERRVHPADLEGGTFTISNLGGIGGTAFSPIVNPPQVAILGVSTAARKPVWAGDGFEPRLMMPLSLTYDHRVIDGADGARFLRWICAAIEQPILLAMKG